MKSLHYFVIENIIDFNPAGRIEDDDFLQQVSEGRSEIFEEIA